MAQPRDTIGDWDSSQLQKVVRELIALYPPDHLTGITIDDLTVAGTFTAQGSVTYSLRSPLNTIGASGQVAFANGWVNGGAPYFAAAYTKTEDGWIRMRGAVKSGTVGLAVTTLPPGVRPASTSRHAVVSNGAFGIVDIDKSGNVIPQSPSSSTLVSLDGIQFKAA